ncbi:MAG TPA: hypothetical protein PKM65_09925 [Spirochaetota bacterium]|nr:hypothetical protein [Spirochaetota bacterium]HNT12385.1 hypothetical protein [Spirochaetota bacterium]
MYRKPIRFRSDTHTTAAIMVYSVRVPSFDESGNDRAVEPPAGTPDDRARATSVGLEAAR